MNDKQQAFLNANYGINNEWLGVNIPVVLENQDMCSMYPQLRAYDYEILVKRLTHQSMTRKQWRRLDREIIPMLQSMVGDER